MPLIGNRSVLLKSPGRFLNGRQAILRSNFNRHGEMRGAYESYDPKSATPNGHLSPSAWVLPKKAGGMSSRNVAGMSMGAVGLAVGGITTTGSATLAISFATATGALIASGNGSAAMGFTVANALLTASIAGAGSASITFSATAPPGALASGYGTATMAITFANAQPYPLNDASPLRTGTASFAITGSLVPYAIGVMGGSTDNNTVLTTSAIASEVWSTLATSFTAAGTMGNKLNSAASGGVDYTALGVAVWASVSRTLTAGAAPDTAAIAAAVLDSLNATTIPVDMVRVKGQALAGSGSEADPWGP